MQYLDPCEDMFTRGLFFTGYTMRMVCARLFMVARDPRMYMHLLFLHMLLLYYC